MKMPAALVCDLLRARLGTTAREAHNVLPSCGTMTRGVSFAHRASFAQHPQLGCWSVAPTMSDDVAVVSPGAVGRLCLWVGATFASGLPLNKAPHAGSDASF